MVSFSPIQFWKHPADSNSLSSILYDNENDKSSSSLSQGSNKGFSIKEICPDASFTSEAKHQRVKSQHLDLLSPQVLFSHMRKNSKAPFHEKKNSLLPPESEEMNSTRMPTSQSRRISEMELVGNKDIPVLIMEREEFCKVCKKCVQGKNEFCGESRVEDLIFGGIGKILSHLCWCPQWVNRFKMKVCEECGNRL